MNQIKTAKHIREITLANMKNTIDLVVNKRKILIHKEENS